MARKSLPSSVTEKSNNKSFRDRMSSSGNSKFSKIFPTLGKILRKQNNNTNERDASVYTANVFRGILENQDKQNAILKQILGEIKSGNRGSGSSNNEPGLLDLLSGLLPDIFGLGGRKNPRSAKPKPTNRPRTVPDADTGKKKSERGRASSTNTQQNSNKKPTIKTPPASAAPTGPSIRPPGGASAPAAPAGPPIPGSAPSVSALTPGPAGIPANPSAQDNAPPGPAAPPAVSRPEGVIRPPVTVPTIPTVPVAPEGTVVRPPVTVPAAPGTVPEGTVVRPPVTVQQPERLITSGITQNIERLAAAQADTIIRMATAQADAITRQATTEAQRLRTGFSTSEPSAISENSRYRLIQQGQSEFDAAVRTNRAAENARLQSLIDIPPRPSDAQRIQGIPPTPTSPATSGPRNFFQDQIRTPLSQRQEELVRGPRPQVTGPRPSLHLFDGGRSAALFAIGIGGLTGQSAMGILTSLGIVSGLVLSDNATRYMGRALGSTILTKVPVIGTLARVFFAAQRAREEDYIGAFLDLTSGVVSLFGPLGTAASFAMDIGIITRDLINHFKITSDLRDMAISKELQAEMVEILKPLINAALQNLIYKAPPLSLPNGQLVENGDLRELYRAAKVDSPEGNALYEFIGAETMVSLGQLFERRQGNGLLQRGMAGTEQNIREGFQRRLRSLSRQSTPPQSNKDIQEKGADADLVEDQEYEKIIFDADSIKFEGLADAVKNTSFSGGGFVGSDLSSMIRGDTSGLGTGTFREGNAQPNRAGDMPHGTPEAAMAFFISKGWTPEQAAGIVGNLYWESSRLNPSITGDSGRSYGLAQWDGNRQRNFYNWSGRNIRGSSFEQQLEFVQYELTQGTEKRAGRYIRGAQTAEDAAIIVSEYYERPGIPHMDRRKALANQFLAANQRQSQAQPQQLQPNPASSSGVSLSQAGTNMVAADQQRVRVMQGLINNMLQGMPEQPPISMPPPNNPRGQNSPAEPPLRFRLEQLFSY